MLPATIRQSQNALRGNSSKVNDVKLSRYAVLVKNCMESATNVYSTQQPSLPVDRL